MRKDVRLGLAVGGVLLAVILVGIIVGHQKKNEVGLDQGKGIVKPPDDSGSGLDVTAPSKDTKAEPNDASHSSPAPPAAHDPQREPTDKGDDGDKAPSKQWDLLFASSAQDPLKPSLTGSPKADSVDTAATNRQSSPNGPDSAFAPEAKRVEPAVVLDRDNTPATRPSSSVPRTHKVEAGETLSSIARTYYGQARYYLAIQKANPNLDPKRIRPGMTINLPSASEVKSNAAQDSGTSGSRSARSGDKRQAPVDSSKQYVVQSGDTLSHIALKLYGRRDKAEQLYIANKDVIGPDSGRLKIGMVLKLPEAPVSSSSR